MLGDARADAVNAQAGANSAILLLQVEQYLAEEPLFTKSEAVVARKELEDKLYAEASWQRGSAWGAGTYSSLEQAARYLEQAYYPQDKTRAEYADEMATIRTKLTDIEIQRLIVQQNLYEAEKVTLTHQLTLFPGATVAQTIGGYGIPRPSFNHPGGNADYINGAAGANTGAILLQLEQYYSMEALLPYEMQVEHRKVLEDIISSEIVWQVSYAWGAIAYQSLQRVLGELRTKVFPVYDEEGLTGTDFGGFSKSDLELSGEWFALSDIIPITKQQFSRILDAMDDSDWYVAGVTRLFSHDEYVEMIAKAWSNPYYAQEWLKATEESVAMIGFHPSTCADIIRVVRTGQRKAINYADAMKACLTPKKKKGLFGGVGGIIIMIALAVAAYYIAPYLASFIANAAGLTATAATTITTIAGEIISTTVITTSLTAEIAASVLLATASSAITQVATTGEISGAMVGVAALSSFVGGVTGFAASNLPTTYIGDIALTPVIVSGGASALTSTLGQQILIGEVDPLQVGAAAVISSLSNAGMQTIRAVDIDINKVTNDILAPTSLETIEVDMPKQLEALSQTGDKMFVDDFVDDYGNDVFVADFGNDGMVFEASAPELQTVDYSLSEDYSNVIGTDTSFGEQVIKASASDDSNWLAALLDTPSFVDTSLSEDYSNVKTTDADLAFGRKIIAEGEAAQKIQESTIFNKIAKSLLDVGLNLGQKALLTSQVQPQTMQRAYQTQAQQVQAQGQSQFSVQPSTVVLGGGALLLGYLLFKGR